MLYTIYGSGCFWREFMTSLNNIHAETNLFCSVQLLMSVLKCKINTVGSTNMCRAFSGFEAMLEYWDQGCQGQSVKI